MDCARLLPLALAALLLAMAVAGPAAAGTGTGGGFFAPKGVNPDAVSITVGLHPNGDATWNVQYRVRLRNDNDTQAFQSLQHDIRNNRSVYRNRFASRINSTVNASSNATGRSMRANNYTVSADIRQLPQTYGVVTYTFDWHGFATKNSSGIHAGDAISGFYVDNQTTLQFTWPNGYHLASASPRPNNVEQNSVGWTGRHDFTNEQPRVVLTPASNSVAGIPVVWVAALALVVVLAGGGFVAYRSGALDQYLGGGGGIGAANGGRPSDGGDGEPNAGEAGGNGGESQPPPELLSNEEQVERFLREQGGRAKQQALVDATGWTEAKTSQVLKKMRENGRVESFRIGRENVLRLPEEDGDDDDEENEEEGV